MVNKTNINFKSLKAFIFTFVFFMMALPVSAFAMEDGAYLVTRNTSYVNPQTGQTADGGTNIALGESMCASMIENQALVEQSDGKTYVTLGIGMMSNITSVRIQVQSGSGYREVPITLTGSCQRDGDTCNHYRFEVSSIDNYISPIVYVEPMGREVQFFVSLNSSSAISGTGNFVSEMVTEKITDSPVQENSNVEEVTSVSDVVKYLEVENVDTNSNARTEVSTTYDNAVDDENNVNNSNNESSEVNKEDINESNSESDIQDENKDIMLLAENDTDSNNNENNSTENTTSKNEVKAVDSKSNENTDSTSSSANIGIIVIIAVVCVVAVGGVLLYRKKSK